MLPEAIQPLEPVVTALHITLPAHGVEMDPPADPPLLLNTEHWCDQA